MPSNRPRVRTSGALTRKSVRRGRERPAPAEHPDRLRHLKRPAAWLAGIVLAVAAVTFQDVLGSTVKAILPLDRLPDRLSPRDAIDVVEVKDVKDSGRYVVRGGAGKGFDKTLRSDFAWQHKADVVDAGESEWMITLQGRAAQQVRITDIVPQLVGGKCTPPLRGDLVLAPGQGVTDVIPLEVAIDGPVPRLTGYRKGAEKGEPYFTGPQAKQITLNQNESESFLVRATSGRGHCLWRYRVEYQVGGSTAAMTLSREGGKPFELTGELSDAGGYGTVYFPSFTCLSPSGQAAPAGRWYRQTGADYARARNRSKDRPAPCPKG
ncbi:hypothetical protein ACH4Q6_01890 [Streptomyces lydicus]|uniref:hypothetical protein n=1 Tax=Streptomyces lydicus TaxID=47763 RepID=UPI0037ACF64E